MEVSKRITELKDLKGLTTNKLANKAGISQSFLREVEAGTKKPTVETLQYICDALEISLRDFFDEGDEDKFCKDELLTEISKLTAEQRKSLSGFLKTL